MGDFTGLAFAQSTQVKQVLFGLYSIITGDNLKQAKWFHIVKFSGDILEND